MNKLTARREKTQTPRKWDVQTIENNWNLRGWDRSKEEAGLGIGGRVVRQRQNHPTKAGITQTGVKGRGKDGMGSARLLCGKQELERRRMGTNKESQL